MAKNFNKFRLFHLLRNLVAVSVTVYTVIRSIEVAEARNFLLQLNSICNEKSLLVEVHF